MRYAGGIRGYLRDHADEIEARTLHEEPEWADFLAFVSTSPKIFFWYDRELGVWRDQDGKLAEWEVE